MTVTLTDCDLAEKYTVRFWVQGLFLPYTYTREPSLLSSPCRVCPCMYARVCPCMLVYAHVYIYVMPDQSIVTITGKLAMFTKYYILWK